MTTLRILAVIALGLVAPRVATADDEVTCDSTDAYGEDNDWCDGFVELSAGVVSVDAQLGPLAIEGRAAAIGVGGREHRRGVHLEYAVGLVDLPDGVSGTSHELALRARQSLVMVGGGPYSVRRADGWIEAGVGGQLLVWSRDRVARPIASLGAGFDLHAAPDQHDYLGGRLAVRLTAAQTPDDPTVLALCAGTCAMRETSVDLGVLVTLAVVIGR